MLTFAFEKTTGQLVGVVSRTSQPDGAGDPKVLFAPGVSFSDDKATAHVTIPALELDLKAIDLAAFPALWYDFRKYQMKDGDPVLSAAPVSPTLAADKLSFNNVAAGVQVYARIEGGDLTAPISHAAKVTVANYVLSLPPLPSGDYRFTVVVQGIQPHVGKQTF